MKKGWPIGLLVRSKSGNVNIRKSPTSTATIVGKLSGATSFPTTGTYDVVAGETWIGIKYNNNECFVAYSVVDMYNSQGSKLARINIHQAPEPSAEKKELDQTQTLINNLVATDAKVHDNISKAIIYASAAGAKKIDVSAQMSQIATLSSRLQARQKVMENSTALKIQKKTSALSDRLNMVKYAFSRAFSGLGEPITISTGVIVAATFIAGAAAAYAVYQIFKPKYDESTVDLKVSETLEKALASLTPEEAEAVKKDLEKQIDKAYNTGKEDGSFFGMGKTVKTLLFVIAGVVVGAVAVKQYKKYKTKFNNNDTTRQG